MTNKIAELKQDNTDTSDYHENPFLKLLKVSKKDKQINKSQNFTQQLESRSFNTSSGASKSSLRRRKRKAKEELKPKMDELLQSLPATTNIVDAPTSKKDSGAPKKYINSSKGPANIPNATKKTGHSKIMHQESKNFNSVLKDPQFRASPFSALKNAIAQNLQNQ